MSSYVSLYNETTGDFDTIIIDNAQINTATINTANITTETVGSSNITNAIIGTENVTTSTISNLTIGNVLYFPDGLVTLPSIAFANEHSTGFYRYGTNQIGLVTNGVLRGLITNTGLVSVYDVEAGGQFLSNYGSISVPSFSFIGSPSTGLFSATGADLSLTFGGVQLYEFNNLNFTPVVTGINLGNSSFPWNNCYFNNLFSTSSSLGAITCTSINNSGTTSLGNTLTCNSIISTSSCTVAALTTTSISNSGTMSSGSITSTGNFNNGTNSLLTGALSCSSINCSGTSSLLGTLTTNALIVSGLSANSTPYLNSSKQLSSANLSHGQLMIGVSSGPPFANTISGTTNQVNVTNGAGSITLSTPQNINTTATPTFAGLVANTTPFVLTSSAGSTTNCYSPFLIDATAGAATNYYGLGVLRTSSKGVLLGINSNPSYGSIPNDTAFFASYGTTQSITIGRGDGHGFIGDISIYIDGASGNVQVNNNLTSNNFTTAAINCSSINNSGSSSLAGTVNCGTIISTGNFNNGVNNVTTGSLNVNGNGTFGTNSITCGSLVASVSGTNPFSITSNVGSTSNGFQSLAVNVTSPVATNLYGIGVSKFSTDAIMMGINKNSITGDLPASCTYLSSYNTNSVLTIGRGNGSGLPNKADILIDGNGAITTTNNIQVIYTCTTSQSINSASPITFTTWNNTVINQGNTTYSTGVWTIKTAGVYQCAYDVVWASSASGFRQCYIAATSGDYAHSMITSVGAVIFPQSNSAPIKCSINDTISLSVYQSTGSALNIAPSGGFQVRFCIVKIQ